MLVFCQILSTLTRGLFGTRSDSLMYLSTWSQVFNFGASHAFRVPPDQRSSGAAMRTVIDADDKSGYCLYNYATDNSIVPYR